jgi:ATP-dependent Clp protease ATP-binding subunit ClpX
VEIDTTNILFIAGGAFVGLDNIVKNRIRGTSIGFQAQVEPDRSGELDKTTPEDLIKYGMIPEFVGRFPSWVALQELTLPDLISILTGVKNCYVEQYQWVFEQDNVALEFTSDALELVAKNTIKNKTGARGLHSELERVLLPHMFNLSAYHDQNIGHVQITEELVNTPTKLEAQDEQAQRKISNSR